MSDFDDLDDLLGPLRSAATPAEHASERNIIALMVANHASKGTTMFTSRRARIATLIAAGVIGFGGVAAAGPAAYDLLEDEPVEEEIIDEPAEEPAEEPAVDEEGDDLGEEDGEEQEIVEAPMPAPAEVEEPAVAEEETTDDPIDLDDDATTFDENLCLEGNHGKTVSAAARGDLDIGQFTQRDVAQSSCGKMDGDEAEDDSEADDDSDEETDVEEEAEVDEAPESEEVEEPAAPSRGKSDQAPGQNGNKTGNGKKGR